MGDNPVLYIGYGDPAYELALLAFEDVPRNADSLTLMRAERDLARAEAEMLRRHIDKVATQRDVAMSESGRST